MSDSPIHDAVQRTEVWIGSLPAGRQLDEYVCDVMGLEDSKDRGWEMPKPPQSLTPSFFFGPTPPPFSSDRDLVGCMIEWLVAQDYIALGPIELVYQEGHLVWQVNWRFLSEGRWSRVAVDETLQLALARTVAICGLKQSGWFREK